MVEHAGGRSLVIPLPHPSGASSWIHESRNKVLLEKAIELIGEALLAQLVAKSRPRRSSTPLKEA
jgi:hypothetical protein